jgi:response regulator NasT
VVEAEKLKNELEEVKVVNRAKLLLMQCLSMSETQAHRYIEKQAMNRRTSKLKIAKQVIRTYQN